MDNSPKYSMEKGGPEINSALDITTEGHIPDKTQFELQHLLEVNKRRGQTAGKLVSRKHLTKTRNRNLMDGGLSQGAQNNTEILRNTHYGQVFPRGKLANNSSSN